MACSASAGVSVAVGGLIVFVGGQGLIHLFSGKGDGSEEQRFVREIVFGKRHHIRYYELTSDPEKLPEAVLDCHAALHLIRAPAAGIAGGDEELDVGLPREGGLKRIQGYFEVLPAVRLGLG